MKDIKEKVRDKNPKIRILPPGFPKTGAFCHAGNERESRMVADKVGRETGEESPVEYAGNRIERGGTAGWKGKRFCRLSWWKEAGSENL